MLAYRLSRSGLHNAARFGRIRPLSSSSAFLEKPLPPRRTINENEITESFLKGTGPGGQKINKTSSAVQLKHLPTGIVVKHQGTRSRDQNRKVARRLLSEKLEEIEKGSESRTAVKAEKKRVKKASGDKKKKRKYKKLDDEKTAAAKKNETEAGSWSHATALGALMASGDQSGTDRHGTDDTIVALDHDETVDSGQFVNRFEADEDEDDGDSNAFDEDVEEDDDDDDEGDDGDDGDDYDASADDWDGACSVNNSVAPNCLLHKRGDLRLPKPQQTVKTSI